MKREILFKAKDLKGNWVKGNYFYQRDIDGVDHLIYNGESNMACEIEPETLCQYTNLKDKNGNKIFEGDILQVKGTKKHGDYETNVIYKRQGFTLKENFTYLNNDACLASVLITGNVHDNE